MYFTVILLYWWFKKSINHRRAQVAVAQLFLRRSDIVDQAKRVVSSSVGTVGVNG
jgi:hypothetical protein